MIGPNAAIIQAGRAFHKRLMSSECTILVVTGKTLNNETGKNEDTVAVAYIGPCKIRIAAASAGISEREPLGQAIAVQETILSLPVAENTGLIPKNALVRIETNPEDPALEGAEYRVKAPSKQTSATARRYIVEQVL